MEPIKISMRGLAEVACAKPSQKQSKLKRFKFPESEESVGRSNYYVWAISAIKHHHRGEHNHSQSSEHGPPPPLRCLFRLRTMISVQSFDPMQCSLFAQ